MNSEENKSIENVEKEIIDIEKLADMLTHIHNDLENVKRELIVVMHKVDGVAFLHERTRREVEEAINVFDVNLDQLYSPIDEKDKKEWEEHLKSEIQEREELEEL